MGLWALVVCSWVRDCVDDSQVVMVICSYRNREFIRVGYWVANTYALPLPEGAS